MKQNEKSDYEYFFTGIRIGDDFAIVTNANELFCEIGMSIKTQSPFRHTMVAELTNGAHGYVPTAKAFEGGSYETWFGEHSYLTTRAGEIIEKESLDILNCLKRVEKPPPILEQHRRHVVVLRCLKRRKMANTILHAESQYIHVDPIDTRDERIDTS